MLRRRTRPAKYIRKYIYLILFLTILILYYMLPYPHLKHLLAATVALLSKKIHRVRTVGCTNVLEGMLYGHWWTRNLTKDETDTIELFLETARSQYQIPHSLDRPDGRCGNIRFNVTDKYTKKEILFRALCNPKGDNPCCMDGRCVATSEMRCRCQNCFDLRQRIHAEYSQWRPSHPQCHPLNFSSREACSLLSGGSLIFLGDSALRHFYIALLLLLKGDPVYGALNRFATQDIRYTCLGLYMFSQRKCRYYMDSDVAVCDKTVFLKFIQVQSNNYMNVLQQLRKKFAGKRRSLIITGIGLYDNFNLHRAFTYVLAPLAKHLKTSKHKWPKLVWASPHAPGLLKTPTNVNHKFSNILEYNRAMNMYLRDLNVPVFDTFNLTDGVVSFDGSHYGFGLNMMKAQIFLNYVKEQKHFKLW